MGCDTKGYIVTECKDVKTITQRIKEEIRNIDGKNPEINMTPTWESLALHIAELATNGKTFESMKIGKEQLQKMARLADKYVESQKKGS